MNVVGINVEPDYGYVSRIAYVNGGYRVTYGNDLGLNDGWLLAIWAKTKGILGSCYEP